MLTEISNLIKSINEAIETSANMTTDNRKSENLIGTTEAV